MQSQILVVANPPHGKVNYEAVANILGLEVDDARLKIGFPAPEVLMALDPESAIEFAGSLKGAGVRVAMIDGRELVGLPWPAPASSFEFRPDGLTVTSEDNGSELPYDVPVVGVYCEPPPGFPAGGPGGDDSHGRSDRASDYPGLAIAESIEWMAVLDLYSTWDGEVRRISIARDLCDFGGLGDMKRPTPAENMAMTVVECERRFTHFRLDRRLVNVRPRQRFLAGDTGFDMDLRRLFSFGTLLLRQALESISPELRDLTQYELGSRLAYVLSRQE